MEWKNLFAPQILRRGSNYFCQGAVDDFELEEDRITAMVYGSDAYQVEIDLDGDSIEDMYCSCPYAESGDYCKHMAAVLFEWESMDREEWMRQKQKREDEIRKTVMQADEKIVRQFLMELFKKDSKNFSKFQSLLDSNVSEYDMKQYQKQIDEILKIYHARDVCLPYCEAGGFIQKMQAFLKRDVPKMMENGAYLSAFQLSTIVFLSVANVDMDDSDGYMGEFGEFCVELWREILDMADGKLKKTMYNWFVEHTDGSIVNDMEGYLHDILLEDFEEMDYLI